MLTEKEWIKVREKRKDIGNEVWKKDYAFKKGRKNQKIKYTVKTKERKK